MLVIKSPAFTDGGEIPAKYTADGIDVSPPLEFIVDIPGVNSLALIVDDPCAPNPAAPTTTWTHWVMYNLSPNTRELKEATQIPKGAAEALNDWMGIGWRGPMPQVGRHTYIFQLFALDCVLPDLREPTRAELVRAMKGHVLGEAHIKGQYQRKRDYL